MDDANVSLRERYEKRLAILEGVRDDLVADVGALLSGHPRIDRISARVKEPDRFVEKAERTNERGEKRYTSPLEDIQDQVGLRVVVYYKSDVDEVVNAILEDIQEVEDRVVEPPEPESFGYEARHLVCLVPQETVARHDSPVDFFELQVGTLFQHAWAEANHDLGYKPARDLNMEERRQIAFAAAQAWGADEIFDALHKQRTDGEVSKHVSNAWS